MLNLILVMAASVFFAYCSEWTGSRSLKGRPVRWNIWLVLMTVVMTMFSGLRTGYNDTAAYISGFSNADSVAGSWQARIILISCTIRSFILLHPYFAA